jgi:hypothetical protein
LQSQSRNFIFLIAVVLITLAAILWLSYRIVIEYPGGDHFLGIWNGLRGFLSDGHSPYSDQIQSRILEYSSDREQPLLPGRSLFNYPFYILLPVLPVALVGEYALARTLWMAASAFAVILLILIGSRLAGWRPRTLPFIAVILFALFNPYTVTAVITGDFAVFTALLFGLALLAIKGEMDELAGLSLAFSTITPYLSLPLITFVTMWAISIRRDRLILWTYGSVGLFVAGSWLIQRDWIGQYIQMLVQYYALEGIFTPGQAFRNWWAGFGAQMGWILTAALGLMLLAEWRLAYGKGFRWFLWTACLTLAAGGLLGLRTDPSGLVSALLPFIFFITLWDERWGGRSGWSSGLILLLLFLGLWALVPRNFDVLVDPGIYPVLYFALPVITILGLYWVRWLAVRPRGTVMDELRKRGEL